MREQQKQFAARGAEGERRGRYMAGTSARETAYKVIRDKIIYLDLKPGEAINDKALAEELEMSRTPVREALIILSVNNMVVVRPQSGTFVAPIDLELVEVEQFSRYALEKEIVSLACGRLSDAARRRYEENLQLYHLYYYEWTDSPDRYRRLLGLDNEFHHIAFAVTGKEESFSHMVRTMQHIERLRSLSLAAQADDCVYSDHRELADALREGNLDEALRRLEIHLNRYRESLRIIREKFPQYFFFD